LQHASWHARAIFTGQIAAALAAGNSVLAKPAEQTPLIAAQAVQR
jgi:RHH-type proline utilization regulon transcriptional repressor/proline dehydrogenase/delta 1-pyrroline-5-carboxylate dehydrogenase